MNPFNKLIILNLGVDWKEKIDCQWTQVFHENGPAIFQLLKNPLSFKDRILQNLHECLQENESMKACNGLGEKIILYIFSKTKE